MRDSSPAQSCPYSPHLGPVGCLPAPNIFPLAKETSANGKMFWNYIIIQISPPHMASLTQADSCSWSWSVGKDIPS